MKFALALLLIGFTGYAGAESCERCAAMAAIQKRMKDLKPDFGNIKTIRQQTQLVTDGSDVIYSLIKQKSLDLSTAKALITLIAKLIPYDQESLIVSDYGDHFRRHFNKCENNTFRPALEQALSEGKISAAESDDMIKWWGLDTKNDSSSCTKAPAARRQNR